MKIIFDIETTGLDFNKDEILQFTAIDENGNILLNTYVKPQNHLSWKSAEQINHISPKTVKSFNFFSFYKDCIQKIFDEADELIAYNGQFDIKFLKRYGIIIPNVKYYDVMKEFSNYFYEINDRKPGTLKRHKLVDCAKYLGFDWKNNPPHNSLSDVRATLFCYNKLHEL